MQVVVDGLLTHYESQGKGKLVVLLHGWGDSSKGLSGLQSVLSRKYQVLTVDMPGFGATEAPKGTWKLDNYAQFVSTMIIKLKLPPAYAIIGHSNGGAVAIRGVGLGVLQPQKLVLLAASGVRTKNSSKKFLLKAVAKTGKTAILWLPKKYRLALRKGLYMAAGSDMLVVPELEETFKQTVAQDVQADAAAITVPTLLVYASGDQDVPLSHGQRLQKLIPDSRLSVINDAGHFVHLEQPEQVAQQIEEFLK